VADLVDVDEVLLEEARLLLLKLLVEEREFFIDNLLVRIHFIIEMIWWTSLARWEFDFPFPGSLTSTFQNGSIDHYLKNT